MAAVSNSEIWKPLFIAIGLSMLLFGGFKARAFVICLIVIGPNKWKAFGWSNCREHIPN